MKFSLLVKSIANWVKSNKMLTDGTGDQENLFKYFKHKSNSEHEVLSPLINKEHMKSTITSK